MIADHYKGPERRRFDRIPVDFTLTYKINEPLKVRMLVEDREVEAEISNLSESGMSLVTNYNIPIASILLITFNLIDVTSSAQTPTILQMSGEVRYNILLGQAGHRLGINFTEISPHDRQVISAFVSDILKQ
ncbi:PilZ domain-containing protein [Candidatus Omnitrophota bacterium]